MTKTVTIGNCSENIFSLVDICGAIKGVSDISLDGR
jgi:hypothetical protein